MVKFAIIIASFNDLPFLELLFESLFSTHPGAEFRCIIVDDHSNDGSEHSVRQQFSDYATVLRPEEKSYYTRANNVGLDWAKNNLHPDYYFILNSDTQVTNDWAAALHATSLTFNAGIVGPTLLYPDGRIQHAGAYGPGEHFGINKHWIRFHQDRIVPWVTGAALCIRKDVVVHAGYLPVLADKQQYDASDRAYCLKARLNYRTEVAVSAGSIIYHDTLQAEAMRRPRGDY